MSRFTDWSHRAVTNPTFWVKHERPPATISVMTIPAGLAQYPVDIMAGEPHADIGLDHARIRWPDPFDHDDLTTTCRDFIVEAIEQAVDRDGRLRWITWADGTITSCNPINGRRHHRT